MRTKYMKSNWMHFTLALGLLGAMAPAVHAESFSLEVPFAFEAAGENFPAGVYVVEPVSSGVIMIHNTASGERAAMIAWPAKLMEVPRAGLVFDRSAEQRTLAGVNLPSGSTLTISPSKRLTAARTLSSKGSVVLTHP
jgi:hypothetical protein